MSNRTEYKGGFTCCEEDYGWRFWNKTGEILAKTATTKNDVSWRRNNIKELQNNHWLCPSEVDGSYEGDGFTPICRVYGAKNYTNDIGFSRSTEECEANARLIEQAPVMWKLLKQIVEITDFTGSTSSNGATIIDGELRDQIKLVLNSIEQAKQENTKIWCTFGLK